MNRCESFHRLTAGRARPAILTKVTGKNSVWDDVCPSASQKFTREEISAVNPLGETQLLSPQPPASSQSRERSTAFFHRPSLKAR